MTRGTCGREKDLIKKNVLENDVLAGEWVTIRWSIFKAEKIPPTRTWWRCGIRYFYCLLFEWMSLKRLKRWALVHDNAFYPFWRSIHRAGKWFCGLVLVLCVRCPLCDPRTIRSSSFIIAFCGPAIELFIWFHLDARCRGLPISWRRLGTWIKLDRIWLNSPWLKYWQAMWLWHPQGISVYNRPTGCAMNYKCRSLASNVSRPTNLSSIND